MSLIHYFFFHMIGKVSSDDLFLYCGTSSGDIMMINTNTVQLTSVGPVKKTYSLGITAIQACVNGELLIGTGEGKIHRIEKETFRSLK